MEISVSPELEERFCRAEKAWRETVGDFLEFFEKVPEILAPEDRFLPTRLCCRMIQRDGSGQGFEAPDQAWVIEKCAEWMEGQVAQAERGCEQ